MQVDGKIWGLTSLLFCKNNVEVHRIECIKGGCSSKHKHEHKFNMFFVEQGELKIHAWKDYNLVDQTILKKHQSCIIPPGEFHKFESMLDGTIALEIYWTEISSNDIIREKCGEIINVINV